MLSLNEHSAAINDLAFNKDDTLLFTCSNDGSVYEWIIDKNTKGRSGEFVLKNIPAFRIAVSPSGKYILSTFDQDFAPGNKRISFMRSYSSVQASRQGSANVDDGPSFNPQQVAKRSANFAIAALSSLDRSPSAGSDAPNTPVVASSQSTSRLVLWTSGHISGKDGDFTSMDLSHAVTAIAFGQLEGRDNVEFCVLGLVSGSIVISLLPIPLRVYIPTSKPDNNMRFSTISSVSGSVDITNFKKPTANVMYSRIASVDANDGGMDDFFFAEGNEDTDFPMLAPSKPKTVHSSNALLGSKNTTATSPQPNLPTADDAGLNTFTFDETKCKVLQLHDGSVNRITVATSGFWIVSAGSDGSMFMMSTTLRAKEAILPSDVPEASSQENHIILTDHLQLKLQLSRIEDKDAMLDDLAKDKKSSIARLEEMRLKEISNLNETMHREIMKRDEIILMGRQEQAQTIKKYNLDIENLKETYQNNAAETEVIYERKLAQEIVYMQNMKQSYDEYVAHCRLDLNSFQKKSKLNEDKLLNEKDLLSDEFEKQKRTLLEYCDYVGERHKEVLKMMTDTHDNQK